MIKIFKLPKYDKTQYDKHFGIFYHMALSKYDKKNLCPQDKNPPKETGPGQGKRGVARRV